MVNIGIISDTHITEENFSDFGVKLIAEVKNAFKKTNMIVHAGDLSSKLFLDGLKEIAPVKAIKGETDFIGLEDFTILTIGNYNIGVIHEEPENIENFSKENDLHILIFGHTHQPLMKGTNFNTLLINPGSPTFPKAPPAKPGFKKPTAKSSVVLLMIDSDNILSTYFINLKLSNPLV